MIAFCFIVQFFVLFNAPQPSVATLVGRLEGQFNNFAQAASMPDSISPKPALTGQWLNPLCLHHRRVSLPALGSHVLYLQWHEASCDGALNRQRLWAFRQEGGRILMDFYSFKNPDLYKDAHLHPERLKDLTLDDLVAYPEGCTLQWRYEKGVFYGLLDPKTCHIIARSGRNMALEAVITVSRKGFSYRESGQLPDGNFAFKVPGWSAYAFKRA